MEKEIETKKEQIINLINKQNLTISATNKIISLNPNLIQLNTVLGGIAVAGENLELIKLDNDTKIAEIVGNFKSLKYIEAKSKEPFFRKIFK